MSTKVDVDAEIDEWKNTPEFEALPHDDALLKAFKAKQLSSEQLTKAYLILL